MKFNAKAYELMKKIPKGKVTSYKIIAEKLGTKAYRAIGNACNRNPYAPAVPCHRVVNHSGKLGGFGSGLENKIKLLEKEGIKVKNGKIVDFKKKTNRPIYLSFVGSKVFVAVSYTRNLFEPKLFRTLLDFGLLQEYFEDLRLAAGIVEDLNLNTRIWSKE